jgi:hypothetical protein
MLQPAQAFLMEALGVSRGRATAIVSTVCVAGNVFVLWFSRGLTALDTLDFWVGSFFVFVMAALQIVFFGWVFGLDRGWREAHEGARIRIPRFYRFVIKYVAPLYLLVIFVGFCVQTVPGYVRAVMGDPARGVPPDRTAQLTWLVILGVIAGLAAVVAYGSRRWRRMGMDLDGTGGAPDAPPQAPAEPPPVLPVRAPAEG